MRRLSTTAADDRTAPGIAAATTTQPALPSTGRLDVIDCWRGLIIALMVLDHVRDFFHFGAFVYAATDPAQTNLPLYVTRWMTHLCAPTFVFLAGASIRLRREKGGPRPELARFLLTRGLWLIILDLTIVSFGINMGRPFFFVQVLYAIGMSTIAMAALIRLQSLAVGLLGALMIACAPVLIAPLADAGGIIGAIRTLTILPGDVPGGFPGIVLYPFVPWLGVMCVGYALGHVFRLPRIARNRVVGITAIVRLLGFAIVLSDVVRLCRGRSCARFTNAAELGIFIVGGVPGLDRGVARPLSHVPLVRTFQTPS